MLFAALLLRTSTCCGTVQQFDKTVAATAVLLGQTTLPAAPASCGDMQAAPLQLLLVPAAAARFIASACLLDYYYTLTRIAW